MPSQYEKELKAVIDTMCVPCMGTGKRDDAEPGDISYREWTCTKCDGTGKNPKLPANVKAPVPELEGSFPIVLYFGTEADRDGFAALVQAAHPNMVTRKL